MSGVDAVVVNYRTHLDLDGFLESFDECAAPEDRLHIVLVSPRPDDLAVAKQWASHPQLGSSTTLRDNVGYGRACNQGAANGVLPVVALFNADTRLSPGILSQCGDALMAHADWGVLGPRQVDDMGRLTHVGIWGTNTKPHFRGAWQQPAGTRFMEIEDGAISVSGAAYFVRRDVWDELTACPQYQASAAAAGLDTPGGAFLESGLYYEDMWCSLHARVHGLRAVYYGAATMVHRWHKSIEANGGEPTLKYQQARELFRRLCDDHAIERE